MRIRNSARSVASSSRLSKGAFAAPLEGKRFEDFVEDLSSSFIRVPVAELSSQIDRWIREIVLGHELDRGTLALVDPKSEKLVVRNSWSRDNITKLPVGMILDQRTPWFHQTLKTGRPVALTNMTEVKSEVGGNHKTFRRYIPKSSVTLPVRIDGVVTAALGFATLKKERSWPPRLLRRVQLVAEIFGNALERRRAAEENALLRYELNHVSRTAVVGELTASITHQLHQPMGAIMGNAEAIQSILENSAPDLQELRNAAADIVQDSLRATEIFRGLRAFFRKDQLERTTLDLGAVSGEVVRLVRSDALFRNVSLTFNNQSSLPRIVGDRIQLQQAILNLILNAFDAVSECEVRDVAISIEEDGDEVRVAVRDSGRGIEPDMLTRIFEPFFTTKAGGMGMGLSIANSIIVAHGGRLRALRNVDRGATFQLSLPISPDSGVSHLG
jgi:signal transduction histidine kinase